MPGYLVAPISSVYMDTQLLALLSEQCSSCSSGLRYSHHPSPITQQVALNVPSYSQLFRHIADPKKSSRESEESQ